MRKRILSVFMTLVMLLSLMPVMAKAETSGQCGDLTWTLDDNGTLTISGTGGMRDGNSYTFSPWFSNRDMIKNVKINKGVTSIGNYAFYRCRSLTSVTIPDGVTRIGKYAFCDCSSLTSVTIPDSVTSIYAGAFSRCGGLNINVSGGNTKYSDIDGVLFNKNKTEIAAYAKDIIQPEYIIPDSVTNIGRYAFYCSTSLTSVTIPDSVMGVDWYAFSNCSSLTSVTIPNRVTRISKYAFDNCNSLTSVTIPDSVTSIGERAFNQCRSLMSVTIPGGVTSIGKYAFSMCSSLTSVTIQNGVTNIGEYTFSDCSSLTNVTIPGSVTSIGKRVFEQCSSLTSVMIQNGVKSIGEYVFSDCSSLTSVSIPDSVTRIDKYAFSRCGSLNISVSGGNTNYSDIDGVLFNKNKTEIVIYAKDVIQPEYIIPDSVTSIYEYAFCDCSSLTSVTIPDSVTSIWCGAFYNCSSLTSVTIPDGVASIGQGAFCDCSSLTSVAIPDSVTSIAVYVFSRCGSLNINVSSGNSDYSDIDGVLFNKDKTEILAYTQAVIQPEYIIPDSVTRIGYDAFGQCSSLTSVTIPDSVTNIGRWAFSQCSHLKDVYYSGTEQQWNAIDIADGNEYLTNATIHYNSTMPDGTADYESEILNYSETDGKYIINSSARNNTDADISCILYSAVYAADGTLKSCGTVHADIAPKDDTGVDIAVPCTIEPGDTIKTFMWSEDMTALSNTAKFMVE